MAELLSREDLRFLLFDWLDVEELLAHEPFIDHDRESITLVLDLAQVVAVEQLLPCYAELDRDEPVFDAGRAILPEATGRAVSAMADSGLIWASLPSAYGGSDLPLTVFTAASAWLQAANISAWPTWPSPSATSTCCSRTGRPRRTRDTWHRWSRAGSPGRCACPRPRPSRAWPTSRRPRTSRRRQLPRHGLEDVDQRR